MKYINNKPVACTPFFSHCPYFFLSLSTAARSRHMPRYKPPQTTIKLFKKETRKKAANKWSDKSSSFRRHRSFRRSFVQTQGMSWQFSGVFVLISRSPRDGRDTHALRKTNRTVVVHRTAAHILSDLLLVPRKNLTKNVQIKVTAAELVLKLKLEAR